jgi:HD-GYP domain-containing protein (c-di-GMP phosphodiesterase class II)
VVLLGTFPGLTTAVLTNVFLSLFEKSIVYYSILNILFAWLGYVFIKRGWLQRVRGIIGYIVTSGLLTGVLGGTIQLVIKSLRPYKETVQLAEFISKALSIDYIPSFFLSNISFSLLDRALVTLIAFAIIRMIPDRIKDYLKDWEWRMNPSMKDLYLTKKNVLGHRVCLYLHLTALMLSVLLLINGILVLHENHFDHMIFEYVFKVVILFSGFFLWILSFGAWFTAYYLLFPINGMSKMTEEFFKDNDNEVLLHDRVENLKKLDIQTNDEVENLYHSICALASDMERKLSDLRNQSKTISTMQNGLLITMADMVENRDADTGFHIQKTADYVRIILDGLKRKGYYSNRLTDKYINDVYISAPLHDIGKIRIPDAVLNKPGKLTDDEYEVMKTHTTAGREIIEKAITIVKGDSYLKEARNMAGYHHEKWDGTGYPEGLSGEVIPLSARIMAVADVFDAVSSKRVYKPAMSFEKAISIIEEGSGTHFDPKCVEVFIEAKEEVKSVMKKYS